MNMLAPYIKKSVISGDYGKVEVTISPRPHGGYYWNAKTFPEWNSRCGTVEVRCDKKIVVAIKRPYRSILDAQYSDRKTHDEYIYDYKREEVKIVL